MRNEIAAREVLKKHPLESMSYGMDFRERLTVVSGVAETLSGSQTVVATPDSITVGSPQIEGNRVTFPISGGTTNVRYKITVSVTTSFGRVLAATGVLIVEA